MLPILHGHKLDKFVLKDEPSFMADIFKLQCDINEDVLDEFPLEQQIWILQDQFIVGCLLDAIHDSVAGLVIEEVKQHLLYYENKLKTHNTSALI